MKLITRDTDYAVRALAFIAGAKAKIVPVSELVNKIGIPRPFLRKILQRLNNRGVLVSYKGKGGGFSLARPITNILLLDLMRIFQGPFKLNECVFKKRVCPNIKTCKLKKRIDKIQGFMIRELKDISLALLLEEHKKQL